MHSAIPVEVFVLWGIIIVLIIVLQPNKGGIDDGQAESD